MMKKRGKVKRLLSLALALMMVLSLMPGNGLVLTVYAEGSEASIEAPAETETVEMEPQTEPTAETEPESTTETVAQTEPETTLETVEQTEPETTSATEAEPTEEPAPAQTEPEETVQKETEPEETEPEETEPEETAPVELVIEGETRTYIPDADALPDNDELFAMYAMQTLYGGGGISLFGNYGENVLNETELAIYNELKTAVGKIAAGEVSDTDILITSDLGIESWVTTKPGNELESEAAEKFNAAIDTNKIIDCLLVDCPYELYWYNKVQGGGVETRYSIGTSTSTVDGVSTTTATISGLSFSFAVASAYQDDDDPDTYTTATAKTGAASAAVANAQAVITANEGKTDYAKLVAYKEYICGAVEYNHDAVNTNAAYGDPWQLIYVFDNDTTTNVVCEGYAKAFQYLCDLTTFSGDVTCYTVTGNMGGGTGAGAHMWNIVTMEDNKNYLVDVTNSDTGTVGQDGSLFLAGTSGNVADGYTFGSVSFAYDDDTKSLYGDSILTLAAEDYTEPVTEANGVAKVVIGNGDPTYYKTITEAFAAVQSGDTATITLLADATVASGKITVNGDVTLVGDGHTLSGAYASYTDGLINIPTGAKLTITSGIFANSSSAFSSICTVGGGTLVINDGTITATGSNAVAVQVYSGSAEISGGTFTGTVSGYGNGYGIYVNSNGNAKLTGGTFTGSYSAVFVLGGKVSNLLETGYIYYKDSTYASGDSDSLGSGTYTVVKCENHSWGAWSDTGDGTHTRACEYCGQTESDDHTYGTDGKCTAEGCEAQATASVTTGGATTFYGTIEDAWAAAKGQTATVTLLASATVTDSLTVDDGDNITLTMAEGVALSGSIILNGIVNVNGGAFTLESGTISNAYYYGVKVQNGTFVMNGGTISSSANSAIYAMDGTVTITGGSAEGYLSSASSYGLQLAGSSVNVSLSGGTFSGIYGKIVGDMLAEGYAYQQNGSWVTNTNNSTLTGTVTVEKAPIQSVSVTADQDTVTYGYADADAPTLTAEVKLADTSMAVSYQWYQDGEKINGATDATYTIPTGLSVKEGGYAYTCTATADGYSLTSEPVTVTVQPADITGAVVTVDGTYIYNGSAQEPAGTDITVTLGSTTLTGSDYIVSYSSNVNAGPATVTITGKGNYTGEAKGTFEIQKSTPTVAFNGYPATATYSGQALANPTEAEMTITGAAYDDVDFTWSASPVNAGEYTLTAKIKETTNTAAASADMTVTITPKAVTAVVTLEKNSYEYTGEEIKPNIVTVKDGDTEIDPKEYDVSYSDNVSVGTATVTITDKDGGNYVVSGSAQFTITKPSLETAAVTLTLPDGGYTYDRTAKTPAVTVTKDGVTVDSSEYDVVYSDNVNAGTVTVTVTAKAGGNYDGSQKVTFKIEKATPDLGTVGYTGTIFPTTALADITLTRTDETVSGTLTLDAGQTLAVGKGTYDWIFIPQDTANYNVVRGTVTLEVTRDSLTGISIGNTVPNKIVYIYEDAFDPTGLTVTATYASGGTADVTDKVTFGALAAGDTSIELSYTEDGVTETCTVTGITVAKKQLDISGMSWNVGTYTYDGTAQGPALEGTLPAGVKVTTTDNSKTDAGTYTAKAEFTLAEGYSDANYEITGKNLLTEEWTITQRTAELTWSNTSLTYNGTAQKPTAAVSNLIADDACTITVTGAQTNAGSYTAKAVGLSNSNYKLLDDASTGFTIGAKDITVNITLNGGVYGGTITPATAEPVGVVGDDVVDVTLTYTGTANDGTMVDSTAVPTLAGTYTVTASITNGNYNLTGTVTAEFVVARANAGLSVSPDKADKTYGDAAFALTATHKGNGAVTYASDNENVATVDTDGTVTLHNAGEAVITVTLAETANYAGGEITVTITVARKNDTLKVEQLTYTVTYGDADFTIGYETESGSTAAFTSSDTKVATVDAEGQVHIVGAGTATITLQTADSQNYNAVSSTVTVVVAQKAVTVTADDKIKVYGEDDPDLTYTASDVLDGDDLNVTLIRDPGTDVGEYDIKADLTDANPNYDITFVGNKLTIQQRAVTLTWGDTSLTYNAKAQHPAVTVGNLIAGDTYAVTVDGAETNVGSYTATVTGLSNSNYKLPDNVTMEFVIAPKDITVEITPNGGKYGAVTGAEAKLVGVIDGDTVDVTLTYAGTANDGTEVDSTDVPTLAGKYTVTASIADSKYKLTGTVAAEFVVARADAELFVVPVPNKVYGDAGFTLTENHKGDGAVTYASSNAAVATVDGDGNVTLHNAGDATITVTLAQTASYEGDEISVAIKVEKAGDKLTVEELTYEVTYGDADFTIVPTTDSGSAVTFTSSNTSVATVDETGKVHIVGAGEAEITLETAESENYNPVSETVIVKVAPKPVTVTIEDKTKIYGEDDPKLTWTTEGLVDGDTLTGITVTRKDGKNAGSYAITAIQDKGANPNYEITFVDGTLTIERKDIADAVVELGDVLIANGETQTQEIQSVTVRNSKGAAMEVTYKVTGNIGKEPGAYSMTITGTENFTGTATKTFVIAPASDSKVETNPDGDVEIGNGTIGLTVQPEPGAPAVEVGTSKAEIITMLAASGGLTAEELAQVADGADIDVVLVVKDASGTISAQSKAQIEKATNGYTIGQYIDISLYKQITQNGQNGEQIQITGTHGSITISLEVPEALLNTDPSITRTFCIVRNHEGKVEFLPATFDATTNMLTFETDKFSDYAIVYKDTKRTTESGSGSSDKDNESSSPMNTATATSPQTGDDSKLWLWFVLMFLSCGGLFTTHFYVRRKKEKAE